MVRVGLYASNAITRAGLLFLFQSTEVEIVAEAYELDSVPTLLESSNVDVVCLELSELDTWMLLRLKEILEPTSNSGSGSDLTGCVVLTTPAIIQTSVSFASLLAIGVRGLLPHSATPEEVESIVLSSINKWV